MEESRPAQLSLVALFRAFVLGGLTFGGGVAIVTVLERELVQQRRAISRDEFLTYYALARVVPTGTQTALAVSLGHHFQGLKGSLVAVLGLVTPAVVSIAGLAALFTVISTTAVERALPATVLPAALALIAVGVISMSKEIWGIKPEFFLAAAGFGAAAFLHQAPGVVLLAGGLVGIVLFRQSGKEAKK